MGTLSHPATLRIHEPSVHVVHNVIVLKIKNLLKNNSKTKIMWKQDGFITIPKKDQTPTIPYKTK